MKPAVYKVKSIAKIFINSIGLLCVVLGGIMIIFLRKDLDAQIVHWISSIVMILFGILAGYPFNKIKVIIDDEKIEIVSVKFIPRSGALPWNEIAELRSEYFLWPEGGIISLIPNINSSNKFIRFCIWGMPIDLLKDIISHLSPNAKIELYSYLGRKLEGKQTWLFKKQEWHTTDVNYWRNIWQQSSSTPQVPDK